MSLSLLLLLVNLTIAMMSEILTTLNNKRIGFYNLTIVKMLSSSLVTPENVALIFAP